MRWHKGFETGEAVIDEQHRALLELIEQVASATSESPFGPAQQAEFLDRVTEWAISHFATEDALMRDVGLDPGYLAHHRQSHADLLAQLRQLQARQSLSGRRDLQDLLGFLAHWLMLHLLGEDQLMVRRISAARAGTAANDDGQVSGLFDQAAVFESSLGLFSLIAEQNRRLAESNAQLVEARARADASEALYRSVLAALPVGVVVQEPDGRIVLSNGAAGRILGLPEQDLAGRTGAEPTWQAIDREGRSFPGEQHPAMVTLATGQPQRDVTLGVQRQDGSRAWISVGTDLLDEAGSAEGSGRVVSSFMDITARKRFEEALSESQQQLNMVLERTRTGIWDWDFASGEVRFSHSWYTMLGFDPDEFPASVASWERLVHPDDRAAAWAAIDRMRASRQDQQPYDIVFRMRTRGGDWRWINSRAAVVRRDDAGLPARVVGTHLDLTEQRAFESALHDKQEKLAGLFRIAPIGIAMAIQRVLIEVNDTFCGLTGYRRDELVGRETRILYLDQTEYERVARFKYRTGSQDGINEVDTRWVRKDGTAIDVVLNATPLDRQDPARGITFTVLDVTGRRRIEAALRESEEAYRLAMDATQDGVWDWDIATGAVRYSPAWFKIVEAVPGPPHYDSWATRVHPDDWPEVQRTLSEHLAGRDTLWHREHRLRLPSGDWKWVLGRGRVVKRDKTGQPLRMVGTMADISERKAAERERALLSDTLEASLNEIYLFDAESFRFRYVNEGGLRNLGYSRDAIRQLTPLDIKPYLTPAHFQELVAPLLSGERKVQVFESRHRRADGSLYPVDVHLQLFRQDGEGVYLAVIQDTTERKRTEASLKASEERFRLWVEATDSVFWVADRAGALSQPSHSLERLTGLSREQCLGHGRLTAIHPDDRDAYATALARAVARGDAFELQLRYWDAGGNAYRWYLERVVPHRSDDGTVRGWLGAGVAIDRQKRAEAAQQDMLRRKDEFIAMLGHELRNPLAPIRNANELLGTLAGTDPKLRWVYDIIDRHASHLVRLVDDLLDVGRLLRGKIQLQREPIPLAKLVRELAESRGPQLAERAQRLNLSVPEDGLVVEGDVVRLTQVFENLLGNAIRYTPAGGQIWLSVAGEARLAVIRIRDSGIGIPEDLLPHVFDPFAQGERSLDRAEGGLGIGLTVARKLVLLHQGDIEAHSDGIGRGSEFVVRLPLADAPGGAETPGARSRDTVAAPPLRTLRVLVVDDNVDAANSLTMLLEHHGHRVETACDGARALDTACRWNPDLILLDIGLPGMDGFEVARQLRQMDGGKAARIIAVTGYAQPEYRVRARKVGFDGYLVKPVRLVEIRRLLDSFPDQAPAGALAEGASDLPRAEPP